MSDQTDCTATLRIEWLDTPVECSLPAGHPQWHVSLPGDDDSPWMWSDNSEDATPHTAPRSAP